MPIGEPVSGFVRKRFKIQAVRPLLVAIAACLPSPDELLPVEGIGAKILTVCLRLGLLAIVNRCVFLLFKVA